MVAALGILSLGATLATATPASAGTSIGWTYTGDAAPGGKAKFTNNGDSVTVCDVESDGWAANVQLWYDRYVFEGSVQDGGNDGVCATKSFSGLPEGIEVQFVVCLHKAGVADQYCRWSSYGMT
jgi:hypothetical protein